MKLIRSRGDQFILEFARREYRLLREVLDLFPRIPVTYHQLNPNGDPAETAEDQRLLEEALAARKTESRRQLQARLEAVKPRRAKSGAWQLKFSMAELDWFLQVLNDIRVGSWLRLGSPADPYELDLTRENAGDFVALEFCGFMQSVLLRSLNGQEDS
jgi:hypothetical protein